MGFITAVSTCLSKYFTFSGRARRPEYWYFVLFTVLAGIVAQILDGILGFTGIGSGGIEDQLASNPGLALTELDLSKELGVIYPIVSLLFLIPTFAVAWRRMHDMNKTGWLTLLPLLGLLIAGLGFSTGMSFLIPIGGLIAIIATIYVLYLFVSRGTRGENRFGFEPPIG